MYLPNKLGNPRRSARINFEEWHEVRFRELRRLEIYWERVQVQRSCQIALINVVILQRLQASGKSSGIEQYVGAIGCNDFDVHAILSTGVRSAKSNSSGSGGGFSSSASIGLGLGSSIALTNAKEVVEAKDVFMRDSRNNTVIVILIRRTVHAIRIQAGIRPKQVLHESAVSQLRSVSRNESTLHISLRNVKTTKFKFNLFSGERRTAGQLAAIT